MEEYIRNYIVDLPCGYCGQEYGTADMQLVNQKGSYYTFSVFCNFCRKQNFVTVFINKEKSPEPEIELTEAETEKFCTPICFDDILDIYIFLKDFEGDFAGLFPEIKPRNKSSPELQGEK